MRTVLAAALLAVSLASCSITPAAAPTPTETPSPTPTVRVMTAEEAGPVYLSAVCVSNAAANALDAAWRGGNLKNIVAAATVARDASREAAAVLNDRKDHWPDDVADDVDAVVGQLLGEAGYFDGLASSANLDQAYATQYPAELMSRESAQRVRLGLNLPADTTAGCDELGKVIF